MKNLRKYEGKIIVNKNIFISEILFEDHKIANHPLFLEAENVIVYNCDQFYVYNYVNENIFPKLNNLYLFSHPCGPRFFTRFNEPDHKIYLANFYDNYKLRWAPGKENLYIYDIDRFYDYERDLVYEDPKI